MFTENAIKVLEKRYLMRDSDGRVVETPEMLFKRVAKAVAGVERRWELDDHAIDELEQKFFKLMYESKFLPNSPTLMNAGKTKGQLSACFVLPVPDSLDGIFETCKNAALIHKTGGGTGFSFSRLRPANDRVATSTGVASGPVSFMTVYDAATEAIRQGGTRRGANMGILRVDHPDIEMFIHCKRDTSKLNNFNISVAATDKFMEAVKTDGDFDLIHPRTNKAVRTIRAREIFNQIVDNAHATGEPGLVFIDRINASDPLKKAVDDCGNIKPGTEDIEATNPCGEQPLGPGDACNLGSINVSRFVRQDKSDFDWQKLTAAIQDCVRFLDDVIEVNHYPLPFIEKATLSNRRIGLGIMGWAEALIQLGISYDSDEAIAKAREFMRFFQEKAHEASRDLAELRGVFPNWVHSTWHEKGIQMRNATVTTIAPTGTISIIAGTSSGIEPLFAISFVRRVLGGMELLDVNPLFESVLSERGLASDELKRQIADQGTLTGLDGIPEDIKRVWVCSHDISYAWHVKMQVAFQQFTDNAVSKTINFPREATIEDVRSAYLAAWDEGLKGITVYRDASRVSQVLNISKTDPLRVEDDSKKELLAGRAGTVSSPQSEHSMQFSPDSLKESSEKSDSSASVATLDVRPRLKRDEYNFSREKAADARSQSAIQQEIRAVCTYICDEKCPECGYSWGSLPKLEACVMCLSCGYTKC